MAITLNIDYNTKDAVASLEKLKKTTQSALNSSASNVQKLGLQLQKTTQTIESTQAQMEKLADTKIVNPEYKKTIRDINDVSKALKDVESRMSDMRSSGSAYNDYYKQMESDLDRYKKKQDELFENIDAFKKSGISIHDPKVKEHLIETAKYEAKINETKNKLAELRETEQGYTTRYKDAIAEAKQYESVIDELRQKKGSFESSGTTTISGMDTSQYSKLSNTLDNATTRANILVNAIEKLNATSVSASDIDKPFSDLATTSEKVTQQIGILPKIFAKIRSAGNSTASTISSSFKRAGHSIKDSISKGVEDSQQKLKGLGKNFLKYIIGVRSLFLLYRKIREAGKEAFTNLGNQFPEIQSQLNSLSASFGQLKNSIATAFQPIFSVAVPALVTLMNYLVSAMNALANFFATLTGQKYIYKATKNIGSANKAISGTGSAAKESNKQLAEYDRLIVIPQDTGGGGGGGGGGGDVGGGAFEKVATKTSKLAQMIKDAWTLKDGDFTDVGKFVGDWICDGLENIPWEKIKATVNKVAKSLATFLNGLISPRLGYDLGKTIAEALNTAIGFLATFAEQFDWANFGQSLAEIVNGFFKNFDFKRLAEGISAWVDGLADALWNFIKTIDWGQLIIDAMDFASGLSIKTIAITIGAFWFFHGGVKQTLAQLSSGLFTKVSTSIATAFGASPIKVGVSILLAATIGWKIGTKLYEGLSGHEVTQSFREEIEDIWTGLTKDKIKINLGDFIEYTFSEDTPLNRFLGTVKEAKSKAEEVNNTFKEMSEGSARVRDDWKQASSEIDDSTQKVATGIAGELKQAEGSMSDFQLSAKNTADEISNTFKNADSSVQTAGNNIAKGFQDCGENLKSKWSDVKSKFSDVGGFFKEKFTDGFDKAKGAWSTSKQAFADVWSGIKGNFGTTASWFKNTFETAWTNVKNVFSKGGKVFTGIKEGVAETFRTIVNTLIDGINKVVAIPFNAIDGALSRLRNTSIAGISPFGWLPSISTPQLPHLAQGAVIPPNKEFLAVLGDQKQGTNIETPLDTMIQAFKIAFNEVGGNSGNSGNNAPIVLQLNGRDVAEVVWDEEDKRYKQTGSYRPQYGY